MLQLRSHHISSISAVSVPVISHYFMANPNSIPHFTFRLQSLPSHVILVGPSHSLRDSTFPDLPGCSGFDSQFSYYPFLPCRVYSDSSDSSLRLYMLLFAISFEIRTALVYWYPFLISTLPCVFGPERVGCSRSVSLLCNQEKLASYDLSSRRCL